eukprot:c887_g1_i2.p1 GENE.c887_g1_i2~~c887_g1_i2.p1  ORF type:complete len:212 (+),score=28.03 c887_g1_i2:77-712(+)
MRGGFGVALLFAASILTSMGALVDGADGEVLGSRMGMWRGHICSPCGCSGASNSFAETPANITISDSEVTIYRPDRESCGRHREASTVVHEIALVEDDDLCVHFTSGGDTKLFSIVESAGVLHVAYAPELSFCAGVPYTPRGICAPIGEGRSGFYGVFVPMHAKHGPPRCYHDADQMTLKDPVVYLAKVAAVLAVITTAIEYINYRYLLEK